VYYRKKIENVSKKGYEETYEKILPREHDQKGKRSTIGKAKFRNLLKMLEKNVRLLFFKSSKDTSHDILHLRSR
jgi:hypothetical protein